MTSLEHESGQWSWGCYVVVYPAGNLDFADVCIRYADPLIDRSTFAPMTIEALFDAGALPPKTTTALRERYIVS